MFLAHKVQHGSTRIESEVKLESKHYSPSSGKTCSSTGWLASVRGGGEDRRRSIEHGARRAHGRTQLLLFGRYGEGRPPARAATLALGCRRGGRSAELLARCLSKYLA